MEQRGGKMNEVIIKEKKLGVRDRVLCQRDLYEILPFGKTKIKQLIASGNLPLTKVGNDYITTYDLLQKWIEKHLGSEIYF